MLLTELPPVMLSPEIVATTFELTLYTRPLPPPSIVNPLAGPTIFCSPSYWIARAGRRAILSAECEKRPVERDQVRLAVVVGY